MRIRSVAALPQLVEAFDLAGAAIDPPLDHTDRRFTDLRQALAHGRLLSAVARNDNGAVIGAVLGFCSAAEPARVVLRIAGVIESARGRGVGRTLVARFEDEARRAGPVTISLGTDEAVGFWWRLGYQLALFGQWIDRPDLFEPEAAALVSGPGSGLTSQRHTFDGVQQLSTAVRDPSDGLLARFRAAAPHGSFGYLATKSVS